MMPRTALPLASSTADLIDPTDRPYSLAPSSHEPARPIPRHFPFSVFFPDIVRSNHCGLFVIGESYRFPIQFFSHTGGAQGDRCGDAGSFRQRKRDGVSKQCFDRRKKTENGGGKKAFPGFLVRATEIFGVLDARTVARSQKRERENRGGVLPVDLGLLAVTDKNFFPWRNDAK